MTRPTFVVWLVCAGSWLATSYAGEIRGHVTITRGLTKRRVTIPAYQLRGVPVKMREQSSFPSIDELSRMAVYLDDSALSPGTPVSVEMKQQNRQFEPDILLVPVDSTVSFPNTDPIFHNVFSLSKAKEFDLGYYPAGQTRILKFTKPGVIEVYCHLHSNMNGAIVVVPNAWYGRPGGDGNFVFSGVPAGSHKIVAWHKSAGFLRRQIEVPESGSVEVELPVPLTDKKAK